MRLLDTLRIAAKTWPTGILGTVALLGVAICTFCLCFSGSTFLAVRTEKDAPVEMSIVPSDSHALSRGDLDAIRSIEGIVDTTPVLEVPVTIRSGKQSVALTLIGEESAYLGTSFAQGGAFPDASAMPYLVLNEAACTRFAHGDDPPPSIDQLNKQFFVQTGEPDAPIAAKVCGVVKNSVPDEEPKGYISLSTARMLLRANGQQTNQMMLRVRAKDSRAVSKLQQSLKEIGFRSDGADPPDEAQWVAQTKEAAYLLVIAIVSLFGAAFVLSAQYELEQCKQRVQIDMLRFLGMTKRELGAVRLFQSLLIMVCGTLSGIIVCALLPGFLSAEEAAESCFAQPVAFWVMLAVAFLCIGLFWGVSALYRSRTAQNYELRQIRFELNE